MIKKIIRKFNKFCRLFIEIRFLPGQGKIRYRYEAYQKKFINFDINSGDKVLDIGSGGDPFSLATHLADFTEEETHHRSGKVVKDERPFIKCSVERLPFKDKEFDFIYCSHVLEHAEDPGKACKELMRVGKRGYIETPTRTSDILFNIERGENHHLWHIVVLGNSLMFIEWPEKEKRDIKTAYFSEQLESIFKNPVQDFIYNNWDLIYNMFLWERKFNYYVFNRNGKLIDKKT